MTSAHNFKIVLKIVESKIEGELSVGHTFCTLMGEITL